MINERSNLSQSHVATQLARQAARAIEAWRAADAAGTPTGTQADRIAALQGEVSFHPAGGGEAALFQLGALSALIDANMDAGADFRAAERLIGELVRYVEASTGVGRGVLGGYCLPSVPNVLAA